MISKQRQVLNKVQENLNQPRVEFSLGRLAVLEPNSGPRVIIVPTRSLPAPRINTGGHPDGTTPVMDMLWTFQFHIWSNGADEDDKLAKTEKLAEDMVGAIFEAFGPHMIFNTGLWVSQEEENAGWSRSAEYIVIEATLRSPIVPAARQQVTDPKFDTTKLFNGVEQ